MPSSLAPGSVIGGRYRLVTEIGDQLWRAHDTKLARDVALRLVPGAGGLAVPAREAARRAAGARGRSMTTYLDILETDDGLVLVREWAPGDPLSVIIARGPLPVEDAIRIVRDGAAAVAMAHQAGVAHRRINPGNLVIGPDGIVRLTDTAVGSVRHGVFDVTATPEARAEDTDGLARTLAAAVTGRWPGVADAHGLSAIGPRRALSEVGRRGGPELEAIVGRAMGGHRGARITEAAELRDALTALIGPPKEERQRRRVRVGLLGGLALLIVGGVGGMVLANALDGSDGGTPSPSSSAGASPGTSGSPSPSGSPTGQAWTPAGVEDVDPYGTDREENPQTAKLAIDGDPATAWRTSLYKRADLGNLKPGVGLVVDLGEPRQVTRVELMLGGTGTTVELRTGDRPDPTLATFRLVASATEVGPTATLSPNATARYWNVWLTRLPAAEGGFRGQVFEARFFG